MSIRTLVEVGHKLTYRRLQHYMPCLNIYRKSNVHLYNNKGFHSTTVYCITVKDEDKHLSKIKEYTTIQYKDAETTSNSYNIIEPKLQEIPDAVKSAKVAKESVILKRVERLYSDPKVSVHNIYAIVAHELKNQSVLTLNAKRIKRPESWEIIFNVTWPETATFKGVSKTKRVAARNAALKCLQWLELNGKLKNGKPIIYSEKTIKEMRFKPVELNVPTEVLKKMVGLIETYDTKIRDMVTREDMLYSYNMQHQTASVHPILGKIDDTNVDARNKELRNRLLERRAENDHIDLPIFEFKEEILSKLESNRVLLIEGHTGCGKTTQVPQFIMDSYAWNGNATDCNILISQPRRISAISLADRVAYERKETVGDVVGFQVRLERVSPKELGGILFCTTGILLKKLQQNPSLKGCSHVILDEAHERHIDTDMLMILLKRALKQNPDLKVLIMSATINAHLFQKYFDCPAIKVPGRLYPVKMHFLEDIERLPNIERYRKTYVYKKYNNDEDERLSIDYEKIVQTIKWISHNKPHGAILCFLPGWNEITKVQSMLENSSLKTENQLILPIHSKVSNDAQRKIFAPTSKGTRKIILATDIAETGVTVSDVVYVVDSVIRKESRWDDNKDLLRISNRWISKANIQQRKGRAGRVQPGESYHLITKAEYDTLEPHPLPQLLCNPLEKVILDSKTYTDEKAEEFLLSFLEPPNRTSIQKAVNYLIDLEVLDKNENLTALGKRMALFSTHPKFSKALVYSSIFNCIHPVITIASIFSGEDNLFYGVLDHKCEIRKNKKLYHPSSDHIAMAWIFKQWSSHNHKNPHFISKFCKEMRLRQNRMEILSQIRDTFVQQLIQCHLLNKTEYHDINNNDVANKYESNDEMIRALLYSATQQLIEHKNIGFKNGVMRKGVNELRTQNYAKAVLSGESVNYKRKVWPSPYMTYFNGSHCEMRRSTVIRESSIISPLTVLLFNQGETQYHEQDDGTIEILINTGKQRKNIIKFSCDKTTSDVLLEFKDIMWDLVQYALEKQGVFEYNCNADLKQVFEYKDQLLEVLSEVLYVSSQPIEEVEETKHLA